jgi:hypothetical protein
LVLRGISAPCRSPDMSSGPRAAKCGEHLRLLCKQPMLLQPLRRSPKIVQLPRHRINDLQTVVPKVNRADALVSATGLHRRHSMRDAIFQGCHDCCLNVLFARLFDSLARDQFTWLIYSASRRQIHDDDSRYDVSYRQCTNAKLIGSFTSRPKLQWRLEGIDFDAASVRLAAHKSHVVQ